MNSDSIGNRGSYSGSSALSVKDSLSLSKMSQNPSLTKFTQKQNIGDAYHLEGLRGSGDAKMQLRRAAEEMESLLVKMMFTAMKKTVEKTGLVDGGQAEAIFDDMLTEEYSRQFARTGTFKVAEMIYNQYSKTVGP